MGGVRHYGLDNEATAAMYLPFAEIPNPLVTVVARVEGSETAAAGGLRNAVRGLDATLPVDVVTMSDLVARSASQPRLRALLVGGFAAVAILLAAIGVAGALSLSHLVAGLLFGVRPLDVATLAGVVSVTLAATLIATAVPARRAARVDPATALRDE